MIRTPSWKARDESLADAVEWLVVGGRDKPDSFRSVAGLDLLAKPFPVDPQNEKGRAPMSVGDNLAQMYWSSRTTRPMLGIPKYQSLPQKAEPR